MVAARLQEEQVRLQEIDLVVDPEDPFGGARRLRRPGR